VLASISSLSFPSAASSSLKKIVEASRNTRGWASHPQKAVAALF
jgi:hypothetical protein